MTSNSDKLRALADQTASGQITHEEAVASLTADGGLTEKGAESVLQRQIDTGDGYGATTAWDMKNK